jgi:hypothetical protein
MNRVAFILLASGFVLLLTWVVAPAAPSPSPLPAHTVEAVDQQAPLVAEMAAQVERMRNRLEGPQGFPPPERNPFTYGARREPVPTRPRVPVAAPEEPPPPPAPVLPRLLAVVANDVDGVTSLQAVFAVNNGVKALKAGDAIGPYLIRSITEEVVELVEPVTNTVHRLTLRDALTLR